MDFNLTIKWNINLYIYYYYYYFFFKKNNSEVLYEDEKFKYRNLAALVASKVLFIFIYIITIFISLII